METRTQRTLRLEQLIDRVIAERLIRYRESVGITPEDLAELTGLLLEDLVEAERERYVLSPGRLVVLCRSLGLDPAELLTGLPDRIG